MADTYIKKEDGKEIVYERDAFGDWKIGELKETVSSDGSKRLDSGWFGEHSGVVNRADITGKRKAVIDGKDGSFMRDAYDHQRYHFKDSSKHTKTNGYSIGSYSSGSESNTSYIAGPVTNFFLMLFVVIATGFGLYPLYKYDKENLMGFETKKQIVKQEYIDDKVRMNHSRNSIYYRRGKNGESILTNSPDQSIEDIVREQTVGVRVYSYVDANGVFHYTNEVPKDENNQNETGNNGINLSIVESEPIFKFKIPVPKLTTYYDDNGKLNCEYTGKLSRKYRKICDVVKKIPKD